MPPKSYKHPFIAVKMKGIFELVASLMFILLERCEAVKMPSSVLDEVLLRNLKEKIAGKAILETLHLRFLTSSPATLTVS